MPAINSRLQHPGFGLSVLWIAAPALRAADLPRPLPPPHNPVRWLPASGKSLPAIFRMKARSRGKSTARIARLVALPGSSVQ